MNYNLLMELVSIPDDLDRKTKKEQISKETRIQLIDRDNYTCQICGLKDKYGNPHFDIPGKLSIHHVIPNGTAELDNLVTLCKYCHNAIHLLLYVSGKWRYVRII